MTAVGRPSASWASRCLRGLGRAEMPKPKSMPAPLCRRRGYATGSGGALSAVRKVLRVSEEVETALATNKPVVALESTIYTHGAIGRDLRLEAIVREHGAVPAVIGVLEGRPTVGLTPAEVARMVAEGAQKVSRRDLAHIVGLGGKYRRHGGTTISGTMVLARLAGIRVFGTGGLGGVHRGWQDHMDISPDLSELGRTRVAVISSGCKGFLDIPATLEYLETHGVYVSTFADGRTPPAGETVPFPAFWARESGVRSPAMVQDPAEAASIILAQEQLGIESGLLFANPIPAAHQVPQAEMEAAIDQAVNEAAGLGFSGNKNTPFVLKRLHELTGEHVIEANVALVQSNVAVAAQVATALSAQIDGSDRNAYASYPSSTTSATSATTTNATAANADTRTKTVQEVHADVLVAGSVALDLSCDFASDGDTVSPQLHTSNPAAIEPSVGGVGHNVALAAHRASPSTKVKLCTMIGDDIAGSTVLAAMQEAGLDTTFVRQLGREYTAARTAHYVAFNDADKNLMVAMADMAIFDHHPFPEYWASAVKAAAPRWLVVDGNWSPAGLHSWIRAGRQHGAAIAFEPVSTAKSARLFALPKSDGTAVGIFPRPLVDLASPNAHELAAMHRAARQRGLLTEDARWFHAIDALGLAGGARDRFVRLTSAALTDAGVPQQAVQLLPYIPTLITKLGADGALLTRLLARDDLLLRDREAEAHLLVRAPETDDDHAPGGIYMRLYPAEAVLDIVSVNGVGDTFLGALIGGLAQGGRVERLVDVAQRAAARTLRSPASVSADLGALAGALTAAAGER